MERSPKGIYTPEFRAEAVKLVETTSTASRTIVIGDCRWQDRLAAWALIQGFDERDREALSDCRY